MSAAPEGKAAEAAVLQRGNVYLVFSNSLCGGGGSIFGIGAVVNSVGQSGQAISWNPDGPLGASDWGDNIIFPQVFIGGTSSVTAKIFCRYSGVWRSWIRQAIYSLVGLTISAGFSPSQDRQTCWVYTATFAKCVDSNGNPPAPPA